METTLPPAPFKQTLSRLERAAGQNEMTEAICLLPAAQHAFDTSIGALRARLSRLAGPEDAAQGIPESLEFPALDNARRVPIRAVRWFFGAVTLAVIASFFLGFLAAAHYSASAMTVCFGSFLAPLSYGRGSVTRFLSRDREGAAWEQITRSRT